MTSQASDRLRDQVRRRANGRCEYCLVHEDDGYVGYQLDHIIARKHGGTTTLDNLAYACVLCNRYKGSDIATPSSTTGEIVPLFHPRKQRWKDHFILESAKIAPLSVIGRATITLLRLNAPERELERQELLRTGRYGSF